MRLAGTDVETSAGTDVETPAVTLARTAIARGLDALAANDIKTARRWLERAHRIVPQDFNATLILATACLADDPIKAASLFQSVADRHDVRQAWVGLAAARMRLVGPEAAAGPLAIALSRHVFSPDSTRLANTVGLHPSYPGWCAIRSDGHLLIQARTPDNPRVLLDGKPLRGTKLPARWKDHRTIDVCIGDIPLLGSPIDIRAIRRVSGYVEASDSGIRGWAWYPGDPETLPKLTILDPVRNPRKTIVPHDESITVLHSGPLARPRSFQLTRADLRAMPGLLHIRGPDGKDLAGSPLDPLADERAHVAAARQLGYDDPTTPAVRPAFEAAPCPALRVDGPIPVHPEGADGRKRDTAIVIPVHDGGDIVLACLTSVLDSAPLRTRVLVVDDGSSDPSLIRALDGLARQRKITLLRHPRALGFPASANAGIRAASRRDVILLNSDTLVPPGWTERLRAAAYGSRDIGTVTPLSNDASVLSYPASAGSNPRPDRAATNRLDRLARRANGGTVVDIPVGIGFCLYLRRDCLNTVGLFRPDLFAQGYGEENDFCLRARRLGWRSVALTGLFVGHLGGMSFGASAVHLRARNSRIIEQRHPGHAALIAGFVATDPLAATRRRIDRLVWRERACKWRQAAILVTHHDGGGVEQRLVQAAREHTQAGRHPIILRPTETASGEAAIAVRDGVTDDLPNLVYAMPRELAVLAALLRASRPSLIEAHHLAGYPPAVYDLITQLNLPYTVHVHDYAWFCPRVSLVGAHDRYCGEPDLRACQACVADNGHFLKEDITVDALRARSTVFLSAANQVVVPSDDTGIRMRRHFDGLTTVTVRHEDDDLIPRYTTPRRAKQQGGATGPGRAAVCVAGAIGVHKGFDVLLACARDAVRRDLDLEFIVVGHTIDDARMMATGRVFVTGPFEPNEAVALIAGQNACLGFVPSICPETWCLSLGAIWRAGLQVVAFDIGAPAERIRRIGCGILLPLGLSASAINNALVTAIRTRGMDE